MTNCELIEFIERQRKELREIVSKLTEDQLESLASHVAFYGDELTK